MDPLLSTIERALGAQYDVLRLIGRGGMGAVYLARERLLERLVAVKVLPHEAATQHGGRERFLREARTAARLSHPNIVPLYSFAEADGTFLYVMGYVEGESLENRLARDTRIPGDEMRRIIAEIADALDYAHKQGVVHRDVKPDNILIEAATGRAVLTDFGIAKHGGTTGATLTQTGMIVGTPHYMSPEQASGDKDVDGRTDIYALGVIGYRMISGRLPFDGASVQEVLMQHVMRNPVPLAATDDSAPLNTAVMRCLEKEPRDRWPTASALAQACRPRDDEAFELPDDLARLPSTGVRMLGYALGTLFSLTLLYAYQADSNLWMFGLFITLVLAFFTGADAVRAHRLGVSWRDALRMLFWMPEKWWGWWPRALRRPGDVWPRLPLRVRVARTLLSAVVVGTLTTLFPMFAFLIVWYIGDNPPLPPTGNLVFSVCVMMAPLYVLAVGSTLGWRKRFGITDRLAARLLSDPTWNNSKFWRNPDIARLLAGVTKPTSRSTPQTPAEFVAAIADGAAALPEAIRPALAEVTDAARDMARHLAGIDAELAELSRDADPAERAKLEQKLAALGSRAGQIRELLVGQLALLDTLESRRRQLGDDRERYVALLKSVWLQVASLRAESAQALLSATEITGKLRALNDELRRQRAARADVEHYMLGPTVPSGDPVL